MNATQHEGIAGSLARAFINSKLTPLVVVTSVLLGLAAVVLLPREEEPQINVPMIDVMVQCPGPRQKSRGARHPSHGTAVLGNRRR
ncbi:MAG: hypothetical protein R3C68_04020 [Myxococcota bacterium]